MRNFSLEEVHASVDPQKGKSGWRKVLAFFGPAYLVSVGYMDPGNWATDIAGGSKYGYTLIWVLVMSNFMALLLQSLCARLGIVWGKDLAQCNRETYPKGVNFILWILAELAIAATDLAEVLGMAIGLQLLFDIPLLWGVLISLLDTFLLLWLQRLGIRKMELFIIGLVAIVGTCFFVEMLFARPALDEIAVGLIPSLPDETALYIAIGIIGATVMPHNLYLHSALVQTRKIRRDDEGIAKALRYNFLDSAIALNLALFVNAALLILAASVFHKEGIHDVEELQDAHKLLAPLLSTEWAPRLFAIALIAAGQSSTITGTLAGQIVMEGYLRLRINPLLRRMITRLVAIVPAVLVILISGEKQVGELLIFSQVLLSVQLAFAVIPLVHFVSDKKRMGVFAIRMPVKIASWGVAGLISALNLTMVWNAARELLTGYPGLPVTLLVVLGFLGLVVLLAVTLVYPMIRARKEIRMNVHPPMIPVTDFAVQRFHRVALALDYSESDLGVLKYAMALAAPDAEFVLIHITESASAAMMEKEALDYEAKADSSRMQQYLALLKQKGFRVTAFIGYGRRSREIARICGEQRADLLVVGSHGHFGFKDFVFGETINKLRHLVNIPVFIAK